MHFSVCLDVLFDVGSDGRTMAIDLVKRAWGQRALRVGVLGCGFCVGWTKPAASDKSIALRDGR